MTRKGGATKTTRDGAEQQGPDTDKVGGAFAIVTAFSTRQGSQGTQTQTFPPISVKPMCFDSGTVISREVIAKIIQAVPSPLMCSRMEF